MPLFDKAMRLIRFLDGVGEVAAGYQLGEGRAALVEGDLTSGYRETGSEADVVKLLAPIAAPPAIYCIGLNYRDHAEETGAKIPKCPVVFSKPATAIQNPGDPILLPRVGRSEKVDHECELAVVIGQISKNVRREDALDHVYGYTCANDVSARDWQKEWGGSQWVRGKSFDTFCPLGPGIMTRDEIPDPGSLEISTEVNGERFQQSSTSNLIFDIPALIEFLSASTTLLPGTVILTGTPSGVGMAANPPRWLQPGDVVRISIDRIGVLENRVEAEAF